MLSLEFFLSSYSYKLILEVCQVAKFMFNKITKVHSIVQ